MILVLVPAAPSPFILCPVSRAWPLLALCCVFKYLYRVTLYYLWALVGVPCLLSRIPYSVPLLSADLRAPCPVFCPSCRIILYSIPPVSYLVPRAAYPKLLLHIPYLNNEPLEGQMEWVSISDIYT